MSEQHTPGPWSFSPCRCGHPSCRQQTISVQGSVGFDPADARLIAAAPDMLEALKGARALCDGDSEVGLILRAAITKATGAPDETS